MMTSSSWLDLMNSLAPSSRDLATLTAFFATNQVSILEARNLDFHAVWSSGNLKAISQAFLALEILRKEIESDVFLCRGDHANHHVNTGRDYYLSRSFPLYRQDGYVYYTPGSCPGRINVSIEADGEYGEYRYPVAADEPGNTSNCTEMLSLNEGDWSGDFWGAYHERIRLRSLLKEIFENNWSLEKWKSQIRTPE